MAQSVKLNITPERTTMTASTSSWVHAEQAANLKCMDKVLRLSDVWIVEKVEVRRQRVYLVLKRLSDIRGTLYSVDLPEGEWIIVV